MFLLIIIVQGFSLEFSEALNTGGTQIRKRLTTTLVKHLELSKFLSVSPMLTWS